MRKKPCRSCLDFKAWRAQMQGKTNAKVSSSPSEEVRQCPLDKDELGRNTWSFLHTMAANYPGTPTPVQRGNMTSFMRLFSEFYPCEPCAASLRDELKKNPPDTSSQHMLSQWMCRLHNSVNICLGKPPFDCSWVTERWKDGWKDGSCD